MESIAARVKSRRSQASAPAAASEARRKKEFTADPSKAASFIRRERVMRKRAEAEVASLKKEVARMKRVAQNQREIQGDIILEERLKKEAAEKEVAALKKQVQRAGIIWEISPLREFKEVRFTDGVKRFVNPRGDCVNLNRDYIGHFYWHTRRLCRAFTAPGDWAEITAGIVLKCK